MKSRFFVVFLMLTISQAVLAQSSLDLLTVSGRYGFPQTAGEPIAAKNSEYGGLVNLKIPIVLSDKSIFYSEVSYLWSHVESEADLGTAVANPLDIKGYILQTGLVQTLNEKQKLHLLFVPRFMSDGEVKSEDNWQFGGVVMFENRYNNELMLRYGLLYNTELFGPSLTPLLHVDWNINSKWSLVGLFPISLKLAYQATESFSTGFSYFALVTSYRLGTPEYEGDYVERRSIDLTAYARQKIVNNIFLEGRIGYAVGRSYSQYDEDDQLDFRIMILDFGDDRVAKNTMMKGGPIANLRLVYNLSFDN